VTDENEQDKPEHASGSGAPEETAAPLDLPAAPPPPEARTGEPAAQPGEQAPPVTPSTSEPAAEPGAAEYSSTEPGAAEHSSSATGQAGPADPAVGRQPSGTPAPPAYPAAPPPPDVAGLGPMPAAADATAAGGPQTPRPVVVSFWIWILGAALSVVGGIITITHKNAIVQQLRDQRPQGITPDQYEAYASNFVTVSVIEAVVFAVLYVFFAYQVKSGKNWARIVLAVVTVLGVLSVLYSAGTVSTYISLLASVVAVILLYLPSSRAFFDAHRKPRGLTGR
jgi:hypothetical protein